MRVMGFGTFDKLHPGHLSYLKQLRELGDELFVVVAQDNTVGRVKGRGSRQNEEERIAGVRATGLADQVLLGDRDDFYKVLRDHQPNVIGLGYDQRANETEIKQQFPEIKIVRLKPFKPEQYKSSLMN